MARVVVVAQAAQAIEARLAAAGVKTSIASGAGEADLVIVQAGDVADISEAVQAALRGAPSAECVVIQGWGPEAIAAGVERAQARVARLDSERRRSLELTGALERARRECADVYAASITDVVTGLYNKRYFDERLEEEENKAYRTGRPVTLVLVDLDHFKSVNDGFGHEAGDKVLREVAGIFRHCTRNYDICCRYGGEEFALILPATRAEQATHVADRVRAEMKAHRFECLPDRVRLTGSCGIADLPSPRVATREELFRAADAALYRAKHAGRDRTVLSDAVAPAVAGDAAGIDSGAALLTAESVAARVERLRGAIRRLSEDLTRATEVAVKSLAKTLEAEHGIQFFGCAETIANYAARIANALDLNAEHVERIRRAGLLQELGMVPLADALHHKRALEPSERELVKQHPALSVKIADEICCLREELPIILHHHERFDGSGYPRGLRGDRIPLGSRILSVAMAYEAMTTRRPYREALRPEAAIAEIARLSGSWYDPHVVGGFKAAFGTPSAS